MLDSDKTTLITIIRRHVPEAKIFLFGSRARGDYNPVSDIDIAIDAGHALPMYLLSDIREEVEESLIPFSVDIVDMYQISKELREQVMKDRVEWL